MVPAASRRRVGDRRLRVSVHGRRRPGVAPLLLINGLGAPLELFEPLREALGDRLTVAFDAPGVGGSPTPWYPPTMRCLAGMVAELIGDVSRELGPEAGGGRMDVLGLSWGGALAQELAHRHPQRVRRLVLAATTPGVVSLPGPPAAMAVVASPARYYFPAYLRAVAPLLYGREVLRHPELFERHVALRTTMAPDPVGYAYQVAALRRWSSLPWLRHLDQPTLVLTGDEDSIVPLPNARLLACAIPGAHLHVERKAGHLFLLLRAAQLAPLVGSFLDEPTG
jgi:poly(3-hydroxyalkanoate) depolymerase